MEVIKEYNKVKKDKNLVSTMKILWYMSYANMGDGITFKPMETMVQSKMSK